MISFVYTYVSYQEENIELKKLFILRAFFFLFASTSFAALWMLKYLLLKLGITDF